MNTKNIFRQLVLIVAVLLSASCATTKHNVLMGDVITFSEDAKTSWVTEKRGGKEWQSDPIVIHSENIPYDKNAVLKLKKQYQNDVRYGINTSLVYALDLGLKRVKYIRKHQLKNDKLAKYYIFLLTDGLDNTSVDVARNNKMGNYKDLEAYQKKIQQKIKKVMGGGKDQNFFQIWPMLQIGKDLVELREQLHYSPDKFIDFCKTNIMSPYKGSSIATSDMEPIVAYEFATIKTKVEEAFNKASYDFYVPKGYIGKRIVMRLVDERGRKTWFKGRVVKKGGRYYLREMELGDRLTINDKEQLMELEAIKDADKKAIKIWFHIDGLKMDGDAFKVDVDNDESSKQYVETQMAGQTIEQYNSEYDKKAKPMIDTYFLLIMDASQSVGNQVKAEQAVMNQVIESITKGVKMNASK